MQYTAQATTTATGSQTSTITELGVDNGGVNERFNPWEIQTSMFGQKLRLSEVRDNINNTHRVNAFGTLAMFALRNGFDETDMCRMADNKKNICYDLYCDGYIFRKLNERHYKRKVKKVRKGA